ncbi:MAG: hypothetical protein PHQ58_00290 [Rhodoferax sp.]|uniref:hypothetical protein n=1 Tax=Rhodoferax sp. TaxID=50421 RepID=UPI00262616EA|nr:hypothetical protein [Rhodoferax sp.]MDD2878848.1 hypothetical protein [Rhodoferax sp.]
MSTLTLTCVNTNVHSVHLPDGAHIGNLKRVGAVWKFKAVGYDDAGGVEPGGGSLTHLHNTLLSAPDVNEVNAKLGAGMMK